MVAAHFLAAARSTFPAAVPLKFGTEEPMRGRFPRDDDQLFGDLYAQECRYDELMFLGKLVESGRIYPWSNDTRQRFQRVLVKFKLEKLSGREIGRVESFIVDLAERMGCFFAFAEVTESRYYTAIPGGFDGAWGGLPLWPQWMTWYDIEYASLVRPYLVAGVVKEFRQGILHKWSDSPVGAAEISPQIDRDPWVPAEMIGTTKTAEGGRVRGVEPAEVMPHRLRFVEPGSRLAIRIAERDALRAARASK